MTTHLDDLPVAIVDTSDIACELLEARPFERWEVTFKRTGHERLCRFEIGGRAADRVRDSLAGYGPIAVSATNREVVGVDLGKNVSFQNFFGHHRIDDTTESYQFFAIDNELAPVTRGLLIIDFRLRRPRRRSYCSNVT